jgi:exodeoxyribonuclease V beta subunit
VLAEFDRLARLSDQQEVVVRRVESDDDAVKIMTVHSAKGLEFPCVIVADLWKAKQGGNDKSPGIFHEPGSAVGREGRVRLLDVAFAIDLESSIAANAVAKLHREEQKRKLYVAVTRAQHHLCVLAATTEDESVLGDVMKYEGIVAPRSAVELPPIPDCWVSPHTEEQPPVSVAPLPAGGVRQSYLRTSFSGITNQRKKRAAEDSLPAGGGYDEGGDGGLATAIDDDRPPPAPGPAFELPDLPAGTAFGRPLDEEVSAIVAATATSKLFDDRRDTLSAMIVRALRTPFGGPLGEICFADFAPGDRLTEMDFEMALAGIDSGVKASDVGRVLEAALPPDDPLRSYAKELADASFDIPLAGLINGSVDAVLRIHTPGSPRPRLVIADYKTNKLHTAEMSHPAEAYAPHRLAAAMADHHYPLQAVVYGTAVYRMLRWRLDDADPSDCLAGIVYAFVRGTRGPDGPGDAAGRRHGMFVWQPPRSLWPRLSGLLAGDRP